MSIMTTIVPDFIIIFKVGDHVRVIEGRDGSFRVRQ